MLTRIASWMAVAGMPVLAWVLAGVARYHASLSGPEWQIDNAVALVGAAVGAAIAAYLACFGVVSAVAGLVAPRWWERRMAPWAPVTWRRVTAAALGLTLSAAAAGPTWAATAWTAEDPITWSEDASPVLMAAADADTTGAASPDAGTPDAVVESEAQPAESADAAPQTAPASPVLAAPSAPPTAPSVATQPVPAQPVPTQPVPTQPVPVPAASTHTTAPTAYVVERGDSLWSITAQLLGEDASTAQVAEAWPQLYALNREVVGANPGLIFAGQSLSVPESLS